MLESRLKAIVRFVRGNTMEGKLVTVKFDGQSHQVDIDTFASVLMSYASVIHEAAKQEGILEPVGVYVRATEPGSLDVVISVLTEHGSSLLDFITQHENGIAASIILAGGLFEFMKKVAGKRKIESAERNGDSTVTVIADGEHVTVAENVFNFYRERPKASAAFVLAFEKLDENPSITGFEVTSEETGTIRADRSEFSSLAASPCYEPESSRHVFQTVTLTVVKPCLVASNSRRWEFVYNGVKISASIADQDFLKNLKDYAFHMGTTMRVELDIYQEFDDACGAFLNKKFAIEKVLGVDEPPENMSLFDD